MVPARGRGMPVSVRFFVLMALAVLGACSDMPTRPTPPSTGTQVARGSGGAPLGVYLPYGVPVPVGQEITAPPEPYDPVRHGPAQLNSVRSERPFTAPRRVHAEAMKRLGYRSEATFRTATPAPVPGSAPGPATTYNSSEGAILLVNWNEGISAYNDVQTSIGLPPSETYLYAPTHLPSDQSCIEQTTIHWRLSTFGSVTHAFGLWNWCDPQRRSQFQVFESMTSTWTSKYVRNLTHGQQSKAEGVYYSQVLRDANGCWHAYVYNFSTGYYEEKTPAGGWCGASYLAARGFGWTMWELETKSTGCYTFASSIVSSSIKVKAYAVPGGGYESGELSEEAIAGRHRAGCFNSGSYTFVENFPPTGALPNFWKAYTPNGNN